MSIPDPTIDPVTGLPLLNPSDVVQQIPLGVQAFPWQDMGATSLPTRGPLYGDDILPVSSFTAGQHPQTGSAQTVQTDGAHALLVKDVGGGSGSAFAQASIKSLNLLDIDVPQNVGGFDIGLGFVDFILCITAVLFSFTLHSGGTTAGATTVSLVLNSASYGDLTLACLPCSSTVPSGSQAINYSPAIIPPALPVGGHQKLKVVSTGAAVYISGAVFIL